MHLPASSSAAQATENNDEEEQPAADAVAQASSMHRKRKRGVIMSASSSTEEGGGRKGTKQPKRSARAGQAKSSARGSRGARQVGSGPKASAAAETGSQVSGGPPTIEDVTEGGLSAKPLGRPEKDLGSVADGLLQEVADATELTGIFDQKTLETKLRCIERWLGIARKKAETGAKGERDNFALILKKLQVVQAVCKLYTRVHRAKQAKGSMLLWLRDYDANAAFTASSPAVELNCICIETHRFEMMAQTSLQDDVGSFALESIMNRFKIDRATAAVLQSTFFESCFASQLNSGKSPDEIRKDLLQSVNQIATHTKPSVPEALVLGKWRSLLSFTGPSDPQRNVAKQTILDLASQALLDNSLKVLRQNQVTGGKIIQAAQDHLDQLEEVENDVAKATALLNSISFESSSKSSADDMVLKLQETKRITESLARRSYANEIETLPQMQSDHARCAEILANECMHHWFEEHTKFMVSAAGGSAQESVTHAEGDLLKGSIELLRSSDGALAKAAARASDWTSSAKLVWSVCSLDAPAPEDLARVNELLTASDETFKDLRGTNDRLRQIITEWEEAVQAHVSGKVIAHRVAATAAPLESIGVAFVGCLGSAVFKPDSQLQVDDVSAAVQAIETALPASWQKSKAVLLSKFVAAVGLAAKVVGSDSADTETVNAMAAAQDELSSLRTFVSAYREQHGSLRHLEDERFPGIDSDAKVDIDMCVSNLDAALKKIRKELVASCVSSLTNYRTALLKAAPSQRTVMAEMYDAELIAAITSNPLKADLGNAIRSISEQRAKYSHIIAKGIGVDDDQTLLKSSKEACKYGKVCVAVDYVFTELASKPQITADDAKHVAAQVAAKKVQLPAPLVALLERLQDGEEACKELQTTLLESAERVKALEGWRKQRAEGGKKEALQAGGVETSPPEAEAVVKTSAPEAVVEATAPEASAPEEAAITKPVKGNDDAAPGEAVITEAVRGNDDAAPEAAVITEPVLGDDDQAVGAAAGTPAEEAEPAELATGSVAKTAVSASTKSPGKGCKGGKGGKGKGGKNNKSS